MSAHTAISTGREGGNNKHEGLRVLPVPLEHCEKSREKTLFL